MTSHESDLLTRFRRALEGAYGPRLRRVVLFGSRARGDAGAGADYDVAIFLDSIADFTSESRLLSELEADMLYETGAIFSAMPFAAPDYGALTAFMGEVRREGVEV